LFKHLINRIVMAVKSKMSTMNTRLVTKTTTKSLGGPGGPDKGKSVTTSKPVTVYGNKELPTKNKYGENQGGWIYGEGDKPARKMTDAEIAKWRRDFERDTGKKIPANMEIAATTHSGRSQGFYLGWKKPPPPAPVPPKKQEPVVIGKLPIKPSSSMSIKTKKAELIKPKNEMEVSAAIAKPTKKSVPKKDSSLFFSREATGRRKNVASGPFSKNRGKYMKTKLTLNYSGQSEANKAARKAAKAENRSTLGARLGYKKEEKLASAYERNKGIFDGETKGEMKSAIKSYKKSSTAGGKKLDTSQKQAIKTGRTAAKYVGKLEKKKVKTFTPEALSRKTTVKTQNTIQKAGRKLNSGKGDVVRVSTLPKGQLGVTSTMKKGKMQAGKMRY
jgi:hypothetical protein